MATGLTKVFDFLWVQKLPCSKPMLRSIFLVILVFVGTLCTAQFTVSQWQEKRITEPRKTLVYFYTHWCTYCAAFEKNTLQNKAVQQTLGNMYFVKMNAEDTANVSWKGQVFGYISTGYKTGYHSWVQKLVPMEALTYPAWALLSANDSVLQWGSGYLSAQKFNQLLQNY